MESIFPTIAGGNYNQLQGLFDVKKEKYGPGARQLVIVIDTRDSEQVQTALGIYEQWNSRSADWNMEKRSERCAEMIERGNAFSAWAADGVQSLEQARTHAEGLYQAPAKLDSQGFVELLESTVPQGS